MSAEKTPTNQLKDSLVSALERNARRIEGINGVDVADTVKNAYVNAVGELTEQFSTSTLNTIGESVRAFNEIINENPRLIDDLIKAAATRDSTPKDVAETVMASAILIGESDLAIQRNKQPALLYNAGLGITIASGTLPDKTTEIISTKVQEANKAHQENLEQTNSKIKNVSWQDVKDSIKTMTGGAIKNKDMDKVINKYNLNNPNSFEAKVSGGETKPTVEGITTLIEQTNIATKGKLEARAGMDIGKFTDEVIKDQVSKAMDKAADKSSFQSKGSGMGI